MRMLRRMPYRTALVLVIAGLVFGVGTAAWASDSGATIERSADAVATPFLVEGTWFVLEVLPGQMVLTVKSQTDGQGDVVFEIPALRTWNHGGYVSALATALEPGPRRGQIVSALARSSAGKPDRPEKPDKLGAPEKPEKAEKADKPDGSSEVGEDGEVDGAEVGEESKGGDKGKALGENKSSGKNKAPGNERSSDKARGNSRGH